MRHSVRNDRREAGKSESVVRSLVSPRCERQLTGLRYMPGDLDIWRAQSQVLTTQHATKRPLCGDPERRRRRRSPGVIESSQHRRHLRAGDVRRDADSSGGTGLEPRPSNAMTIGSISAVAEGT